MSGRTIFVQISPGLTKPSLSGYCQTPMPAEPYDAALSE
jgi:hypothetical protein